MKRKRKEGEQLVSKATIAKGRNPLDLLLDDEREVPVAAGRIVKRVESRSEKKVSAVEAACRVKLSGYVTEELAEEARDAVVALSGPPLRLSMSGLVESALRRELGRLREECNGGEAFPARDEELRPGRRVG